MDGAKINMTIFILSKSVLKTKNVPLSARAFYNFCFLRARWWYISELDFVKLILAPFFGRHFKEYLASRILTILKYLN